ncbi:MAG: 50S ribosomal protein L25 [Acidimicrobiia bacterium]|nr:50S ribosomal protein L25 [Acidimicrobiia bacterium]
MSEVTLVAERRSETGSRPSGRLRREGRVPAVVYGLGQDNVTVTVPARELGHILAGGANTVVTLLLDGADQLTLVRQVQRHPVRGEYLHVDLVRVSADIAVTAEVPLHITGEPEGVKGGGMLEQQLFSVTVEAKPNAIPNSIECDASALDIGDQLHVSDLAIPAGVTLQHEADELVAQVIVPRALAEEEEEVEGEGEEVEGEEGEGEEGAEGAVAADEDAAGE